MRNWKLDTKIPQIWWILLRFSDFNLYSHFFRGINFRLLQNDIDWLWCGRKFEAAMVITSLIEFSVPQNFLLFRFLLLDFLSLSFQESIWFDLEFISKWNGLLMSSLNYTSRIFFHNVCVTKLENIRLFIARALNELNSTPEILMRMSSWKWCEKKLSKFRFFILRNERSILILRMRGKTSKCWCVYVRLRVFGWMLWQHLHALHA